MAPIPTRDLFAIEGYCERRSPAELVEQLRVECSVEGDTVTVLECRARPGDPSAAWTQDGFAQLRFDARAETWTLWWSDRDGTWHPYEPTPPGTVESLLGAIDADATDLFKP